MAFLAKFIRENRFRQVEFDDMNREFIQEFGVDWMDVLPKWYENRKVPVFFVRDFKVENIASPEDEGVVFLIFFLGGFHYTRSCIQAVSRVGECLQ